jgi:hypothetical protein
LNTWTQKDTNPTFNIQKSILLNADIRFIKLFLQNSLIFKYLLWNTSNWHKSLSEVLPQRNFFQTLTDLQHYYTGSFVGFFKNSNVWPTSAFSYSIKRRVLKTFSIRKFAPEVTMWYYTNLIQFIESYTGRKVYLHFNPFVENGLTFFDTSRCVLWEPRLRSFQRLLGARIFVNESLRIFYIALKFRDPMFLANWIRDMMYRMSFWKYRLLFRYIKYLLRYLFFPCFGEIGFKGVKFTLRGKISVAGNARTRTLFYSIGDTSNAKMNNRVLSHFTTVNSFTGVMGFTLSFYF